MSSEYIPYWDRIPELQSYLDGGDYAGLKEVLPIAISNLFGVPRAYPDVINLRPDRDVYQSYYDSQISTQLSPILGDVRQRNLDASEENLTLIAAKLSKTFGIDLRPEQVESLCSLANLTAKYGPSVVQGIKKVLQADGITDDDNAGKIINALTNQLDQVFDALYGPVGDRLPFYGALKSSLRDTVAIDEQGAILQNVVQRLYPNDVDLNQTNGMTAAMVGQLYSAMTERGLSPLNMNSTEAQRLVRENITKEVSKAEKDTMIQNIAKKQRRDIYSSSDVGKAIGSLARKSSISYKALNDYAQQAYKERFLAREIYELGLRDEKGNYILKENETLSSKAATFGDNLEARNKYLNSVAFWIQDQASKLSRSDTAEDKKKGEELAKLSQRVADFAKADQSYMETGGFVGEIPGQEGQFKLAGKAFTERLEQEQASLLFDSLVNNNIDKEEALNITKAFALRDKLESFDAIKDANDLTDEKYRNEILNTATTELKEYINAFTKSNDELGGKSYAEIAKSGDTQLKKLTEKAAAKKYEEVRQEYINVLQNGTPEQIADFENDNNNREVVTQIKANEVGRKGAEAITDWTAAYSSMQKAIERTGGTVNGQRIQFLQNTTNPAVVKIMEMLTQKDLSNMTSDEIGDFFTAVSTGMQRANINIDQALQYSGLSATEAAKAGGDRISAGKTGTKLGLAAAALARQRGYGNAEQIGSMVAQATGRASKSLISQYTGAIMYGANDSTINAMRNAKAKEIVTKVKNREQLSQEDLAYLYENGQAIMADMGMSGEQQRAAMLASWRGRESEYVLEQGTKFLLGNEDSDMLVATRDAIGNNLQSLGLDKDVAKDRTITQAIVDTMAENVEILNNNDQEAFKEQLLSNLNKKLEKGEITKEQYDRISNLDAGYIFQAVNRGRDIVGKFTGNDIAGLQLISESRSIIDEKQAQMLEGKAQQLFPAVGSPNIYSNIIQEMKKKDANIGSIATTFLTNGGILDEKTKDATGYGIALMSLLRPENRIGGFDYSSRESKDAVKTLQKLALSDADNADKTFNLIKEARDAVKNNGFGNFKNALEALEDPEKVKKLSRADVATLTQTKRMLEVNGISTQEFESMSNVISERSNKTIEEIEQRAYVDNTTPSNKLERHPEKVQISSKKETEESKEEKVSAATEKSASTTETVTTSPAGAAPKPSDTASAGNVADQADKITSTVTKDIQALLERVTTGNNLNVVVTNTVTTTEVDNPSGKPA